jgi:hypothetical protein
MEYLGWTELVTGHLGLRTRSGWVILVSALLLMLAVGYVAHRLVEIRAAKLMRAGIDLLGDKLKEAMVATHLKTPTAT